MRRALLSPQSLVLCALIAITAALVGLSRLTLPRRLAPGEPLPGAVQGFTHQAAGYVRIPSDGAYSLTVFFAGSARLFVDGTPAGTFTPADAPPGKVPVSAGVHRVHVQFTPHAGERPLELAWSNGRQPKAIPPEALSPRSMSALAWRARDVLTPLTIGLAWLWFGTGVWLVARPFFAWYRRQLSEDEVRPVLAILALSLLLAGHGMSWGLPGGWAQDEIGTTDITGGLARWFVGGWYHRYPPLHFYLLALVHLPLIAADRLDMIDFWSPTGLGQAARIGRALTVAMSVGTAALVYLIGRTTLSIRVAVLASLWWVLVLTVAYYGKLTNLDIPYTFWFAVSLLGYVRALTGQCGPRLRAVRGGRCRSGLHEGSGLRPLPVSDPLPDRPPRPQRRQESSGSPASSRSFAIRRCRLLRLSAFLASRCCRRYRSTGAACSSISHSSPAGPAAPTG